MKTETIVMCVVALLIGMLLANMLKNVCGCKTVEGQNHSIQQFEHGGKMFQFGWNENCQHSDTVCTCFSDTCASHDEHSIPLCNMATKKCNDGTPCNCSA